MKKNLMFFAALSFASQAFAGDDSEYMEVTAPNEFCGIMPEGLSILAGWVGASGASGAATLRDAALKAAAERAAQQREKQDKGQQQDTQYDDATQNKDTAKQDTLYREIGLTVRDLFKSGRDYRAKYSVKKPDGSIEEMEIRDCEPSGMLNPKNPPCTQQKYELFTDPTDGVQKWAFTLAVVKPKYNPKHYYADANGYYAEEIDNQGFTIVFETEEDLMFQLRRIAGR